ncbi:hypothetical protein GpartN1_g1124.t1 [Galdieria partita]|uniref:Uncharacterized protein n=1 Tax=Galdieria partita TaxID=83374 RepID=A0A9C7PRE2_9RHOD|nr:hypothetical protein GpartN1_g1124.t1 [Galdieria partita]
MMAFLEISIRCCRTTDCDLRKELTRVKRFRAVSGVNKPPVKRSILIKCAFPTISTLPVIQIAEFQDKVLGITFISLSIFTVLLLAYLGRKIG